MPAELIEAGKLDGATERQLFFRIAVPMMRARSPRSPSRPPSWCSRCSTSCTS
ncbi:MAG: hypothetical protein R3C32_08110 [Chloroflexota bacterium]